MTDQTTEIGTYDYIIIGAGSAGCVLAARLTEDPNTTVLLVEAGGKDKSPLIHMPAGVAQLIGGEMANWYYYTEGQPYMNGRKLFWPRGKVLGGSSSINGMIYIRGHAQDYDQWAQLGCRGWSFADVLPYFKKSESYEGGADDFHGGEGPLHISDPEDTNILFDAFKEAAQQAGYPYTPDFNGVQQEGVGPYQFTIKDGKRWSTASAYLKPALDRPNLHVEVEALTHRVSFEGKRATGIVFEQNGKMKSAKAGKEVLMCGGAVNSPQLLLLSGIGKGEYLQKWGLPVVSDLPGVGQNLQDHLDASCHWECTQPITFAKYTAFHRMLLTGMQYTFFNKGPGRTNALEAGAFLKTRPELDIPDIQIHFIAAYLMDHARENPGGHGFTVHTCQLRPESRGYVALKSLDPNTHALIQPNYLEAEKDRIVMRESLKIARKIVEQPAFDPYRGAEINPGAHNQSDDELDAWMREKGETIYHPIGTAKMGTDSDPMSVVDDTLKVRGVEGLRVIDASVMPTLIGGNTNAPTIMIAEKIADHIRGKAFLPAEEIGVSHAAE